jgi:hypothetical protein
MFLDESGDHSLSKIDPQYPLFVLGGIITNQDYAAGEMTERVQRFKRDLFGRDDFTLHTAEIVRSQGIFKAMRNAVFRERFYTELNALMSDLDYKVVACVIKKDEHLARYGVDAIDPYMFSLNVLVERFCFELDYFDVLGTIIAEKRGPVFDRELDLAWLNLKVTGTRYVQASRIDERIISLVTRPKTENIAGLQLADLVVSPIGRHIMGKQSHEDWKIIERKFRRMHGNYHGAGLVILPTK